MSNIVALVTGASQGFGKAIATKLAEVYGSNLTVILVARNASNLEATATALHALGAQASSVAADLGDLDKTSENLDRIFSAIPQNGFTKAMLINNAGSLGDVTKRVAEMLDSDTAAIRNYMDFNVTSCYSFISRFLRHFGSTPTIIVNISSLLAVKAFPAWGMYATAKAARDMLHTVVALENPTTKTLNYAPGPLNTDMQKTVRETICDVDQKKAYGDMYAQGSLVEPNTSAALLVELIKADEFESGAHLDYYDIMAERQNATK